MKKEKLVAKKNKNRGYNSYKGEITPAVPNIVQRGVVRTNLISYGLRI